MNHLELFIHFGKWLHTFSLVRYSSNLAQSSLTGFYRAAFRKVLEFQKFLFRFLPLKTCLDLIFFCLISHHVNFGTCSNILLPFRWLWHSVYIIFTRFLRTVFFGKLRNLKLFCFVFQRGKPVLTYIFCLPHLILCELWHHGFVYFLFGIYHLIKKWSRSHSKTLQFEKSSLKISTKS